MATTELSTGDRLALTLVAVIAWLGVLLQACLSIRLALATGNSAVDGLVSYFGYFTVLTNIFVALATSLPLTLGSTRLGHWFRRDMVLGCATTAIVFVGCSYHFLLRNVWAPQGLQRVADLVLHYAAPMALLIYWVSFPPRKRLPIWGPLAWCIYPALYLAYALVRGEVLGAYPYYFIDVAHLGYPKVLTNSLWLLIAFVVLGILVYGIAVFRKRAPATQ